MALITIEDLEKWQSLEEAKKISNTFFDDRNNYPDKDFYLRKDACLHIGKRIREEYAPLVRLAEELVQNYGPVLNIRLFGRSNPGPDGEIGFSCGIPPIKVQITCSNEGPEQAKDRDQYAQHKVVSRMFCGPAARQERLNGIIKSIRKKSEKYYKGTDTLLVVDHVARLKYLHGLHEEVCETIHKGPGLPYQRIYIDYGGDVEQVI